MSLALCTCGHDMTDHRVVRFDEEDSGGPIQHPVKFAGTRHRCEELVDGWLCPRPRYHEDAGVPHGPLTGEYLW